jgi:hypothetical protein
MEIQPNINLPERESPEKDIYLYRIENKNIKAQPNGETSHEAIIGQWFTPNIDTAMFYLHKSQQTFGNEAQKIEGANLVIVKIPKEKLERLHVTKHPIASEMDFEPDNYIIPKDIERKYINLDDVQDKTGNFYNFQIAKKQVEEKIRLFKENETK